MTNFVLLKEANRPDRLPGTVKLNWRLYVVQKLEGSISMLRRIPSVPKHVESQLINSMEKLIFTHMLYPVAVRSKA